MHPTHLTTLRPIAGLRTLRRRGMLYALALGLSWALPCTTAQALQVGDTPALQGKTLGGQAFNLTGLRGKVTLLVFWSTDCAVCRDKMPELRANAQGWRGQAFELVTVSLDRKLQDTTDYERLVSAIVNKDQRLLMLWAGDPSYKDSIGRPAHLPAAFLLDKAGRVVEQYSGRVPPEAWDRMADLL
jgi:thiol-disulfide isomerase/thioredoxin